MHTGCAAQYNVSLLVDKVVRSVAMLVCDVKKKTDVLKVVCGYIAAWGL
jgi:hypothetical protein